MHAISSTLTNVVKVTVWIVLFGLPMLFFVRPEVMLSVDPLTELYSSAAQLLGEPVARGLFGGVWLAVTFALFWRVVVSKDKSRSGAEPADLHD
jgi:hypothetical protein